MEHLVISVIGQNSPKAISELALLASKNDCNIQESRMTIMGSDIAIIMLVTGSWNTIAKLEAGLPALEKSHDMAITFKRTQLSAAAQPMLPYMVQVVGLDHSGIVFDISNFFANQNISINDLQTNTYSASLTGAALFNLMMRISVPADVSISDLREQFALLCDDLNLDGILEPERR